MLAVVLGRALLRAGAARTELTAIRQRIQERVDHGRTVAVAVRSASLETKAEVVGLARTITETSVPGAPSLR